MKRLWFVALLGALISSAASVRGAESPKYGGRLVFGIAKDIISLNPFYRTQSTDSFVRELMFQTLLDLDHHQQPFRRWPSLGAYPKTRRPTPLNFDAAYGFTTTRNSQPRM
jgi:hypothetical protein